MDLKRKIKPEPIDDYEPEVQNMDPLRDHDYCKKPKLEELKEPKLEEPDYFEMDRPSEISPEHANFEYPDFIKLETVDDYGSENSNLTQTKYPVRSKCTVCSLFMNTDYFIRTRSKYRRIIVVLGAVLSGNMPISMAQAPLSKYAITTCPCHFPEAVNEIFKILEINHVNQMYSCSIDKKAYLMEAVKPLCPTLTFSQLSDALIDYCRRNGTLQKPVESIDPEPDTKIYKRKNTCSVCSLVTISRSLSSITSTNKRMIMLVGAVLSGKQTVEEAQSLIYSIRCYICEIHLSEAIDKIFKILNIRNIDEMHSCSMDNKKTLMIIVNSLFPDTHLAEFSRLLENFIRNPN